MGKSAPHATLINAIARFFQQRQGGEDGPLVLLLIESFQLKLQIRIVFPGILLGETDGRMHFRRLGQEDGPCLGRSLANDHRRALFDDARLLARNLRQRVAQELYVVEADVGDDAQVGPDDVGAVQPSAQAHLDDGHIHPTVGKVAESHGGGQLEKRWVERLEEGTFFFYKVHDIFLRDGLSVHADAFAEVHQMGRRVEAHAVTTLLQDGGQGVRAGTLAVGARHVDAAEAAMRVSEMLV